MISLAYCTPMHLMVVSLGLGPPASHRYHRLTHPNGTLLYGTFGTVDTSEISYFPCKQKRFNPELWDP